MKNKLVELVNVSKSFGSTKVLDELCLEVKENEFLTLLGPSGCGKTTTLRIIGGFEKPDSGKVFFDGADITNVPANKRNLNTVFQKYALFGHMTIEENLALAYLRASKGTAPFSRISKKDKEFFREQLSLLPMGLEDRMKNPVGLLSGGQRQALTLLMATMVTPNILLLDEHTAALDPATAKKVLDLTRQIVAERKITCLMVTHNMHQALELGNRTLMMDSGNIILDVSGEKRAGMTVEDLLEQFAVCAGKRLDNDRILFSQVE